jgi:hypothetical protein
MTLDEYLKSTPKPSPNDVFNFLKENKQGKGFVCKDYAGAISSSAECRGQPAGMISVHPKDNPSSWGHRMPWWVDESGTVQLASNADTIQKYGSFEAMMNDIRDQQTSNDLQVIQMDSKANPIQKRDEGKWFVDTFQKVSNFQRNGGPHTQAENEQFTQTIFKNLE